MHIYTLGFYWIGPSVKRKKKLQNFHLKKVGGTNYFLTEIF